MSTPEQAGPEPGFSSPEMSVELAESTHGQQELPEPSTEERLQVVEADIDHHEDRIAEDEAAIAHTQEALAEVRGELGLPPLMEVPPSIEQTQTDEKRLKEELGKLEEQKKELVTQQEKERMIEEEKQKILQEKLDELFEEFAALSQEAFAQMAKGGGFESRSLGRLDSRAAESLAQAFREGVKLLPELLKRLPDLLKTFDDQLTAEATKRVEEKLEEGRKEMEEKSKEPVQEPVETQEDETTPEQPRVALPSESPNISASPSSTPS